METRLYFDSKHLPVPRGEYVLWCDGMGTGQLLKRSLARAASIVFKIHQAFDIALRNTDARCYPLMDGIYVTTPDRNIMTKILEVAFSELACEFIHTRGTGKTNRRVWNLKFRATPVQHGHTMLFFSLLRLMGKKSLHQASGSSGITRTRLYNVVAVRAFHFAMVMPILKTWFKLDLKTLRHW